MMQFRPATQEDMAFVRQNPFEGAVKDYPHMEIPDENCFTALLESEILGIFGVQIRWKGVGLFWLMCAKNFRKCGSRNALNIISTNMNYLIEKNNLWRAEAIVRTDFPQAIKMIEFLGFEREGLMKKCCPDKGDAWLYSKIME